MKRRFDYGTSEGLLQQLHPVRGKKMLLPPMLTTILLLLVAALVGQSLFPLPLAGLLLLVDTGQTWRRMRKQGLPISIFTILPARVRAVGSLGYYLGFHLLRYYLLPLLFASIIFPPLGLLALITLLGLDSSIIRCVKRESHCRDFISTISSSSCRTAAGSSGAVSG